MNSSKFSIVSISKVHCIPLAVFIQDGLLCSPNPPPFNFEPTNHRTKDCTIVKALNLCSWHLFRVYFIFVPVCVHMCVWVRVHVVVCLCVKFSSDPLLICTIYSNDCIWHPKIVFITPSSLSLSLSNRHTDSERHTKTHTHTYVIVCYNTVVYISIRLM